MKRIWTTVLGISCCAATVYAESPRAEIRPDTIRGALLSTQAITNDAFLNATQPEQTISLLETRERRTSRQEIEAIAFKVSYVGSLLLTADQIFRSVDSIYNRMEYTWDDGSNIRLRMRPASRGVNVMLKVSRPIDF